MLSARDSPQQADRNYQKAKGQRKTDPREVAIRCQKLAFPYLLAESAFCFEVMGLTYGWAVKYLFNK